VSHRDIELEMFSLTILGSLFTGVVKLSSASANEWILV